MALAIFVDSLAWLYRDGIREYTRAWMNIHWFLYHFFSVPVLLGSFFAPFHRIHESRHAGFDVEDWLGVFAVNSLMRLVGMIVRTAFLVIGIFSELLVFAVGAVVLGIFVSLVIFIPFLVAFGVSILIAL